MNYPKSDRRAIIALASVAVILVVALLIVDIAVSVRGNHDSQNKQGEPISSYVGQGDSKAVMRKFDPNTVDSASLAGMGVAPWKVRNLIHYRNAGARFSTPESMLRTYGWEKEDVERLLPYITISEEFKRRRNYSDRPGNDKGSAHGYGNSSTYNYPSRYGNGYPYHETDARDSRAGVHGNDTAYKRKYTVAKFNTLTKVNLNTADTTLLCSIPGIGTKISQAIIRYRVKLGGFCSVNQLKEIPIVSPELYEWFDLPSGSDVKKLNINTDSFQKLNSHPYISYDQTRDLLQYRRLYGKVKDAAQLVSTGIFTKEEVERLKPYLCF